MTFAKQSIASTFKLTRTQESGIRSPFSSGSKKTAVSLRAQKMSAMFLSAATKFSLCLLVAPKMILAIDSLTHAGLRLLTKTRLVRFVAVEKCKQQLAKTSQNCMVNSVAWFFNFYFNFLSEK